MASDVSFSYSSGAFNYVPEPRLKFPIYDSVELVRNQPLEFQWWNDYRDIRGFTIKIYKGYNMVASSLIYKEELPADASTVKVSSELFNDGQVYTWSLIQISTAGYKSDKSFNSFKVIRINK